MDRLPPARAQASICNAQPHRKIKVNKINTFLSQRWANIFFLRFV
jgi:hypothetical protein